MAQSDLRFVISAADQASAPIENVKRKVQGLADTTRAASTSVTNSMQRMGRGVGGAAQQIGYQVADAAVQLQSGTNALMVFGQQGSQILSIFGPVGALLGAGVAIFSAFGYAALKASEDVEALSGSMKAINDRIAEAAGMMDQFSLGVGSAEEVAVLKEISAINGQIAAKKEEIAASIESGLTPERAFHQLLLRDLAVLEQQRGEYQRKLDLLAAAEEAAVRQQQLAAEAAIDAAEAAKRDAYRKDLFHAMAGEMGAVSMHMSDSLKSALGIEQVDIASGIAIAAGSAEMLAYYLGVSFAEAKNIMAVSAANQPFIPSSGLGMFPQGTGPTFEDTGRMGSSAAPAPTILPTLDEIIAKYAKVGSAGSAAVDEISDATEELAKVSADYAQTIESELTSAFSAVLDGTATLGDALLDFASNVLQKIAEDLFAQQFAAPIGTAIGGIIGGIVPSADGNVFGPGGLTAFANGGVVSGPTVFPFANGTGLMGEAGPEAIMPLSRGPGGKLGVTANGNMAPNIVINNYTSEPATATTDSAGNTVIEIGRAVAEDIKAGGPTYKAIKSTFGISNKLQLRG